ncbi:hypothetical protein ACN27G_19035 [Plantactinospora sp. WMMB334]|uniref:hypothetical protein n=1 Tax=Plantactinospora sp. WMMB334 TaxID=3404119 RepID=UPI003B949096
MRHFREMALQHRRAWWRLWLYCRCGHRWICPDSMLLVPQPYLPSAPLVHRDCWDTPRSAELTEEEAAEIRALSDATPPSPPSPSPPSPARVRNRRPGWDAPTRSQLSNGRPGTLTPAQQHRARRGERV